MTLNIYEENLGFLKENAVELYRILTEASSEFEYKAVYIPGEDNFFIERGGAGCYMHSCYSTENEVRMMFRSMPEDTEVVVLFGLGCGHAVDYLLRRTRSVRYVIIIEPMLLVFKHFLTKHRLRDMGKIGKFTCIVSSKGERAYCAMKQALIGELGSKLYFAFHISYRTVFKDYYDYMQKNVFRLMRVDKTLLSSNFASYKIKAFNYISNLKVDCLPVESLKELFEGRPALIVSAGPSLNKNICQLESVKGKAIVAAVGSAAKILESHGITPHFRISFEWDPKVKELIFDSIKSSPVPIIFTDQLFYKILPEYDGIKFRMVTMDGIISRQVMENAGLEYDLHFSGISVANIALGLLCRMGCSHVVFVGQDMCFVDNKLFAEGRAQVNAEEHKKNLMEVRDIYGNRAYSIIQYLQIKYDLESIIKLYPKVKFINATEGGLGLDGVENMSLVEVMEKELISDLTVDVGQYIKDIYSYGVIDAYRQKVARGVEALRPQLEEILAVCTEILTVRREIKPESGREHIARRCKRLEELERKIERLELYTNVVAKAIEPILKALSYKHGNNSSEKDVKENYTDMSNRVFEKTSSIMEYCLLIKQCIDKVFDRRPEIVETKLEKGDASDGQEIQKTGRNS